MTRSRNSRNPSHLLTNQIDVRRHRDSRVRRLSRYAGSASSREDTNACRPAAVGLCRPDRGCWKPLEEAFDQLLDEVRRRVKLGCEGWSGTLWVGHP